MSPWLHVLGIGEDGPAGLAPAARALLGAAEVVVGGSRHLAMLPDGPQRLAWPSPWDAMIPRLAALRGRRVVALVTGDPLWFSAGEALLAAFGPEAAAHPHPSAFQLAAARLGWPLRSCRCLSVHGRAPEAALAHLAPGARLLLLAEAGSAAALARLLAAQGWGASRLTALSRMGGAEEARAEATAAAWDAETPALTTLAVECRPDPGTAPLPPWGLPDEAFRSDGTLTKREVRALTVARLAPRPGAMLWDVGTGAGSVAVEWMRMGGEAVGVEPRADRRALAAANALALGAPGLRLVAGEAPEALAGLPPPDAAFLGGGLSEAAVDAAWGPLRPHGRLVANAVTIESQSLLAALHAARGGELVRLAVSRAEPLGPRTAWRPLMEVVQWSLTKPAP